jgi:hypothetical protein
VIEGVGEELDAPPGRAGRTAETLGRVAEVGARGIHARDHVDIVSSTWRVTNGAWWAALLGWIWAKSRNGPKSKVVPLLMLYIFH